MKRLKHNARILVTDGGRAHVYRNTGQIGHPHLEQVKVYGHDNPPTRDLGTDKPARTFESVGHHRSAAEQTDYHQQAEDRFTKYDRDAKVRTLRHQKDKFFGKACTFFDTKKRQCTIYDARPALCRAYPDEPHCGYYEFLKFEREHQDDPTWVALTR